VAAAPDQAAVAAPARIDLLGLGAGQLEQGAAAQVAHEHVAAAHEGHAHPLRVEHRVGAVDRAARGAVEQARLAAIHGLRVQVLDPGVAAAQRVVHLAAIPGPPCLLDRRPDPGRIGHDPVQGQRLRGLGLEQAGEQQAAQRKESAHVGRSRRKKPAQPSRFQPRPGTRRGSRRRCRRRS
jgi:hypothetical protein